MGNNDVETRQQIDEEIIVLERRLLALRTQRNRLAPICRLPVETIARIFHFARASSTSRPRPSLLA